MARGRPFKCPCGSSNNVSKGFRPTKTMGFRRLRLCKDCGKKFTPQNQKPLEVKDKNAGGQGPRHDPPEMPASPITHAEKPATEDNCSTEADAAAKESKDKQPTDGPTA